MTLHEIAKPLLTDKDDIRSNGQSYAHIYEQYFADLQADPITLVELGVSGGGSLKMWRKYFTNAKAIIGIDIDSNCAQHADNQNQIEVISCCQASPKVVERINQLGGADIIIDDASHINELTVRAFKQLWPTVKPNGFYCIEDLGLTYAGDLRPHIEKGGWGGMGGNTVELFNDRKAFDAMLDPIFRQLSSGVCGNNYISRMNFHPMQVIIQKCKQQE